MKYVIVTGWRGDSLRPGLLRWVALLPDEKDVVWSQLKQHDPDAVVEGGAEGVDCVARTFCVCHCDDPQNITVPANWDRDGRGAGPKRNAAMMRIGAELAALGHEVVVLAFPKPGVSRGTYNAIKLARQAGLRVEVVEL